MNKLCITKNKLKRIDLIEFRKQLSNYYWQIMMVNHRSDSICNYCNHTPFAQSIIFLGRKLEKREICLCCLKFINNYLWKSVIDYTNHVDNIIKNEKLTEMPLDTIQRLMESDIMNYCDDYDIELAHLTYNESNDYQLFSRRRPDIMFEDIANININLLEYYSLTQELNTEINIFDFQMCLCGRYYQSVFGLRKQCLECYSDFGEKSEPYYEYRKQFKSVIRTNYALERIEEFNNTVFICGQHSCSICYDDDAYGIYVFDCKHFICNLCYYAIKNLRQFHSDTITCPFCRHSQSIFKDNMLTWSKNYMGIRHDLEKLLANSQLESLPISDKCRYRSNCIIQEMMYKKNSPVYDYLIKLENSNLLGWCDYFPDGVLNHQNYIIKKIRAKYRICKDCKKGFKCTVDWNRRCSKCWQSTKER